MFGVSFKAQSQQIGQKFRLVNFMRLDNGCSKADHFTVMFLVAPVVTLNLGQSIDRRTLYFLSAL